MQSQADATRTGKTAGPGTGVCCELLVVWVAARMGKEELV